MHLLQIQDVIEMCRKGKQSDTLPLESRRAQCTIYKTQWAFVCKQKALDGTEAREERQHVARNLLLLFNVQKTYAAEHTSNHIQRTQWQTLRVKNQQYA